jgi:hypothetical protein
LGHDQRFKELLRLFLQPFLEYFFPDVASRLDLASPEFVDKELFEDPPEGTHRVADLVARVATEAGSRISSSSTSRFRLRREATFPRGCSITTRFSVGPIGYPSSRSSSISAVEARR